MPKISWDKLVENINSYFKSPFLPEDHVKAWISEEGFQKTLHLQIGPRDIAIDVNGEVWAAGTLVETEEKE